ncbi:MAG: hypothetical protein II928_02505 [Paludibacteraceae bacterium]|nr:hypothetical protein [Paludibacteraceae bacterium]
MKKLLYVALAAMMLISCDPNAPKLPSKDNKMLDNLSKNLLSLVGEKKKTVISTLEEFGFQKVENPGMVPARHNKPAQKAEMTSLSFFYGNVDIYEEVMEDEDIEILTDYLHESKELAAFLELMIDENNKVAAIYVDYYASNEIKNIRGMYTQFSKALFLTLDDEKRWEGQLGELEDYVDAGESGDEMLKQYSIKKREKFEEDLAELECPFVREDGADQVDENTYRSYRAFYYGDYGLASSAFDGLANGYFYADIYTNSEPEPEP